MTIVHIAIAVIVASSAGAIAMLYLAARRAPVLLDEQSPHPEIRALLRTAERVRDRAREERMSLR